MLPSINMIGAVASSLFNPAHQSQFTMPASDVIKSDMTLKVFQFVPLEVLVRKNENYM